MKVSLELGGNAPFIVFDDSDVDVAVNALMMAKFRNAGQACIASNRILVQEGIYDKFAEKLTQATSRLKCGDGFDPAHTVGPLINDKGLSKACIFFDRFKFCFQIDFMVIRSLAMLKTPSQREPRH